MIKIEDSDGSFVLEEGDRGYKAVKALLEDLRSLKPRDSGIYEVWCEGHKALGSSSSAYKIGVTKAASCEAACDWLCRNDPNYSNGRIWGCKLYDNELDARASFG